LTRASQRHGCSGSGGFAEETATAGLRGVGHRGRNVLLLGHGLSPVEQTSVKNYRLVTDYERSNYTGGKWKPADDLSFFSS
jgi:hypothetical protein